MNAPRIPSNQVWLAMAAVLLGKVFFPFPRNIAANASSAAPWAVLAAGAVTWLLFWPVAAALARRPGRNLIDLALTAGGRPLAIITALALASSVVPGAGNGVRMATEMVVTWFLPHTPQTFAMVGLVAVAALGAALAPADLVWIGAVAFWPTLFAVAVVVMGNVGWGFFREVLPASGTGLLPVAGTVLPATSNYGEMAYLAVISRFVTAPQHLWRIAGKSLAAAALAMTAVVLVYLMVFPLPGGLAVPFPLLEMTRLLQGGRYLERVDALYITFWAFGTVGLVAGSVQVVAVLIQDAFRLPNHRGAVLSLMVAVVAVALFPASQADAVAIEAVIRQWAFVPTLLLPVSIALVAGLRRRGGSHG